MSKILTAAALLSICMAGGAFAGEQASEIEDVTLVRPGREQPVTESELEYRISDNINASQHYDRNDPEVMFGNWINHTEFPGVEKAK
ncbi:MAG: hypothetical protein LBS30_02275 [Planctomycetota bacterium]|jgi:hypothetical protein|nr:hypothetical protein [Planctomycetota bacterium]